MSPLLESVADSIVDGSPVDWQTAESTADARARRLIEQLRLLSSVAEVHRDTPATHWGHLRLIERIGRGSFGVVYRAYDTRLDREVALKLLPADHTTSDRATSIIREGQLLARVHHPNVVTIHGAEQIGARVGLWMEFIRGRTLEELLKERIRFDAADAATMGVELCRAVAAVHAAGLLHRDIKAHNVMRADDGRIVLMDFGTGREAREVTASDLTGTPLYLAPEVLRGEPATVQSDVYSLGVLLYHLLTGSYPVRGSSLDEVRQAHDRGTRMALGTARPDLPARLTRTIDRAIDPQPEQRYASINEFGADLQRTLVTTPRRWLVGAVAAAAVLIATFWWSNAGRDAAAAPGLPAGERPVVVVLPFRNDGAPDTDLFVEGLTHEIIRSLSVIDGVDVKSSTSSFALKDRPRDVASVAQQLRDVNLVLDGSVLRAGDALRVHAQLALVAGDVLIWSDKFDRRLEDVFAIQDQISLSIVNALRVKLGRGQRRYDTNPQLYERYLRARALLQRTGPRDAIEAGAMFQEVVDADPRFAPAYAGIASATAKKTYAFPNPDPTDISPEAANSIIRPAATRALEVDPLLGEAHAAMGLVHSTEGEWENAAKAFRTALNLDPGQTQVHADFVLSTLWPLGRLDEALDVLRRAVELDPLSPFIWGVYGRTQLLSGDYAGSLVSFDRVTDLTPPTTKPGLGFVREEAMVFEGRVSEAIARLEPRGAGNHGVLGYAYAISGRRAEAEALAAQSADFPQRQVLIYAGLKDIDRMFAALEQLAAVNARRALSYTVYPELAFLRNDPRMIAFRQRFGVR